MGVVPHTETGHTEAVIVTFRVAVGEVTLVLRTHPCEESVAPPVLLLPGTAATAEDWDAVAEALSTTRTAMAVNLRGHGGSDWPGRYAVALLADDVEALLDTLPAGPVDLVGHSLGGLVACRVAAARPDRVRRLVLEDVGLLQPRTPSMPDRPSGTLDYDWAMVEQVRPEIDSPDPGWPEVVRAIIVPTLIIGGGDASPVPQHWLRALADLLPDGRVETIDVGHLVHTHEPVAFTERLLAFLDR